MPKNMAIALLLDFYGALLTQKQFDMIDLYYNNDLSLAEIAEDVGITRQGVRSVIKKSELILTEAEEKLGLAKKFGNLVEKTKSAIDELDTLTEINENDLKRQDVAKSLMDIRNDLKYIIDNA